MKGSVIRRIWESITLIWFVATIVGCAGSMRNLAPQSSPIPVYEIDMYSLSFKGVVLKIPYGEQIGKHYDGLAQVPKYAIHWQSGISFGSEQFRLGASGTLREYGYKVLGGDNLLFESGMASKAHYQLGATIVDLKYNTFGSLAGNYNEAVVYVDWQLYDALRKEVVYKKSTRGFAKMSPRSKPAVFNAFNNALLNLMADATFVENLKQEVTTETTVDKNEPTIIVTSVSEEAAKLPDDIEAVLECVVTVCVGSTIGSGFMVSRNGYAITCAHVVKGVEEAQLVFGSGLKLTASVVTIDNHKDLALLKLPGTGYKCLRMLTDDTPSIGSEVFAIGTPHSEQLAHSVTHGVISGLREFNGVQYTQTDASLSPGNSGGPLLNKHGEVVAVVSWKIAAEGFEGLAFGVPVSAVRESLNIEFRQDL